MIRSLFALSALVLCAGCGMSSVNNEVLGQVKGVIQQTPLLCPDQTVVDISLGVLRNGVGSMSTQDIYVRVSSEAHRKLLLDAQLNGALVKVIYNTQRVRWCWHEMETVSVEVIK